MQFTTTSIPAPGTPGGPCRGSCDHLKCIDARHVADQRCLLCGSRLGFGGKITGDPPVHLRCAQQEATRHPESQAAGASAQKSETPHHGGGHHTN